VLEQKQRLLNNVYIPQEQFSRDFLVADVTSKSFVSDALRGSYNEVVPVEFGLKITVYKPNVTMLHFIHSRLID